MNLSNKPSPIVRFVNTYTTAESKYDRSETKSRKRGITRVTGLAGKSKEKSEQPMDMDLKQPGQLNYGNDQNFNCQNRQRTPIEAQLSHYQLVRKVEQLQHQLTSVEKEKGQLQGALGRAVSRPASTHKSPIKSLVQSHYVSCKEDLQKWGQEKRALQEQVEALSVENQLLKMNLSIHEQYISKVQLELDQLRSKATQEQISHIELAKPFSIEKEAQLQSIKEQPLRQESKYLIRELQERNQKQQRQIEELSQVLSQLQGRNCQLSSHNQQLLTRNDQLLIQIAKLQASQSQLTSTNSQQKQQLVQQQQLSLQSDKKYLESQVHHLQRISNQLQQQVKTLEAELEKKEQLTEEILRMKQERREYESSIKNRESVKEDTKYLIRKVDQFEHLNHALQRELSTLQQEIKNLQHTLTAKSDQLNHIRQQLLEVSQALQEKANLYSQLKQENLALLQELTLEKNAALGVYNDLEEVKAIYNRKLAALQTQFRDIEDKLERQAQSKHKMEQECSDRIRFVKADYDKLYGKYQKYKLMAQTMAKRSSSHNKAQLKMSPQPL